MFRQHYRLMLINMWSSQFSKVWDFLQWAEYSQCLLLAGENLESNGKICFLTDSQFKWPLKSPNPRKMFYFQQNIFCLLRLYGQNASDWWSNYRRFRVIFSLVNQPNSGYKLRKWWKPLLNPWFRITFLFITFLLGFNLNPDRLL